MNNKQRLVVMFMTIQGKIASTHDKADMDSDVEELLDYIVAKLDEATVIVANIQEKED